MRVLIWDFDGTLGYRAGGMWSRALLELLRQEMPGVEATADQFRPYLQGGFPWHTAGRPHPDIQTAEQWWDTMAPVFEGAFRGVGLEIPEAQSLAGQVRYVYADPERWRLFDDASRTLDQLSGQGWTHVLLSNHVPELREIVNHLGLPPRLAQIFNSAETGYEKPHPHAFQMVLDAFPDATVTWMIGDSMQADVIGAQALGIPAILVRRRHRDARYVCAHVSEVQTVVTQQQEPRGFSHLASTGGEMVMRAHHLSHKSIRLINSLPEKRLNRFPQAYSKADFGRLTDAPRNGRICLCKHCSRAIICS